MTDASALLELVLSPEGNDPVAETIVDAALEEFLAYGLRRTNVDVVARRAGVSRATLYRRFDGKDALVQAVLVRECRRPLCIFRTSPRDSVRCKPGSR